MLCVLPRPVAWFSGLCAVASRVSSKSSPSRAKSCSTRPLEGRGILFMLFQALVVVMTRVQTGGIDDQLPISPRLATRVIYSSVTSALILMSCTLRSF